MIRLNPDVVIYDADSYLKPMMINPSIWAVLANCVPANYRVKVHTDFFAIRPIHVPKTSFSDWQSNKNAESQASQVFFPLFISNNRAGFIVPNGNNKCRLVSTTGIWHDHENVWSSQPWLSYKQNPPMVPGENGWLVPMLAPEKVTRPQRVCKKRKFVAYEPSLFELSPDCKEVSLWRSLAGPNFDKNSTTHLRGKIFSSFTHQVQCENEPERVVLELVEPLVSSLRDCKVRLSVGTTLLSSSSTFGGEQIRFFDLGDTITSHREAIIQMLVDEYEKKGYSFQSISIASLVASNQRLDKIASNVRSTIVQKKVDSLFDLSKFVKIQRPALFTLVAVSGSLVERQLDLLIENHEVVDDIFVEVSHLKEPNMRKVLEKLSVLRKMGVKAHAI